MNIVYEDSYIIVIDKPAGIAVHPGYALGKERTVVDDFRDRVDDPDTVRPGVVHRLDKPTSGVLVLAKDPETKHRLQDQFRRHEVHKTYTAAVSGVPHPRRARIDVPLGRHPKNPTRRSVRPDGRRAVTLYRVTDTQSDSSLLEVRPVSGRTHQIRVHLHYIGHPIWGDQTYGGAVPGLPRQFLHAGRITFTHPAQMERCEFEAPLPPDLLHVWYN